MSDKKISQLTAGGNAQATDELPIARAGTNVKVTGADIAAAATKLGTITTGVWQGTAIANTYIATGLDVTKLTAGATLPSNVLSSSLTSVGTLTSLTVSGVTTLSAGTAAAPALTTSGDTNTGLFFPAADTIAFSEGGVEQMRLDASGNLGLGVTPSAWYSTTSSTFQVRRTSLSAILENDLHLTSNAFFDGTNWKYIASSVAVSNYFQNAGSHVWRTAAAGTAGNNITFTQAMTLNASGVLMVGTTTVGGGVAGDILTTSGGVKIGYVPTSTGNRGYLIPYDSSGFTHLFNSFATGGLLFSTSSTERMRIDASGNVGIGTASPSSFGFLATLSGATAKTAWFDTTAATAYSAASNFANAIVTLRTGANATGNATGIRFSSSVNGGLEGLFAYVQNASTYGDFVWQGYNGTYNERMRLDSSGNLGVGTTSPAEKLHIVGNQQFSGSQVGTRILNRVTAISVSTATTILDNAGSLGSFAIVNGEQGANRFCDLVLCSTGAAPTVVASFTAIGTPTARTYTRSGSALQLAMASGTYSVYVLSIGN